MRYLPFLFLVACTTPRPWDNAKPFDPELVTTNDVVKQTMTALVTTREAFPASVRMIYGKTSCLSGPNPLWISAPYAKPREGLPFALSWAIEAVATPPPPPADVSLLASFRPRSEALDLTGNGLPGCMLLVEPDHILQPTQKASDIFYYNSSKGLGLVQFVPANGLRGTKLYLQLVVKYADGTTRLSAAAELTIGT